ncbi:hypothetical protein [Streptomyces sp. NBC_00878]|uniref:hypothetical protein n=1 Tax=Streptomyces sp. NBC_00878 TaxID=2975854 RepID=UPI00224E8948|nr:hypothetical protein [Streptomyces sp. NBC_00878]MCX4911903.1 hypothetical protein [Streptomyces sp. NBC_00878]
MHRDLAAFQARVRTAAAVQEARREVLAEADMVLDAALAAYLAADSSSHIDPQNPGGGPL